MDKDMQVDPDSEADMASGGFVFSRPNIVPSPEKSVNFGVLSDNVFGNKVAQQAEVSTFIFANPDTIERTDRMEDTDIFSTNASTANLKSPFSSKNTEETNAFGKNTKSSEDHKSPFATQDVQANVFARVAKPAEDVQFPFSAPLSDQTSIFNTSPQSSKNFHSPLRNEEVEKNVFSSSANSNENYKSPFAVQSEEQTSIFSATTTSPFGAHNSEKTDIFSKSSKANEVHKSPFVVNTADKSNVFSAATKANDDTESPFVAPNTNIFTKSKDPSENQNSPFSTQEPESKRTTAKSKSESSHNSSSDARATIRDRISKTTESLKSPFSVRDLKRSDAFSRLEKNTKRNLDVKLELSKSITCSDVPDSLLLKAEAKKYFEKFGETLKIIVKAKRKMITVYYATDDGALKAHNKSGTFDGQEFKTEWTTQEMLTPKPKKKETVKGKIASILNLDDEVKEELAAMTGLEYNLPSSSSDNLKALAAKAKLKKTKELTTKAITQKRIPLVTKSLVKAAKTIAAKPTALREAKIVKQEEPPSPIEAPSDNKAILKISSAAIEEMQQLIRQPGTTAEERYKILDARDRLMRLKLQKQKSLATAKVTKGSCPDMCPEKERYMREFQRQVFAYEQLEDSDEYRIDHHLAVKQYSRSSADQEEPMPHDLRPVKSLRLTMSYLLHEIADLCDKDGTSLEDWYHFLWDRMRSIRKDITQQELCCVDTVEMVEQCARFHIMASERLCAEGTAVFDPKINSENLTKCLQSLKYMYDDLRDNGVACPNEAEFRAYVVLLNLNNGTFVSELRALAPDVKHSPEVKFALNVYSAMDMNNYARFFILVKQTTYLNACILLRYFNQVRVKAFTTMVTSYCRKTGTTEYDLYNLVDMLGFEGQEEAIKFCRHVGLKCDSQLENIKLKREGFHEPDGHLHQIRAEHVVLSKRTSRGQTVGECIAGCTLPGELYLDHRPHDSFDAQGYLLRSAADARDQNPLQDPYEFKEDDDVEFDDRRRIQNNADEKKPAAAAAVRPAASSVFTFKRPEAVPTMTTNKVASPATRAQTKSAIVTKTTTPSSALTPATTSSSIFGTKPQNQTSSAFSAFKPTTSMPPTTSAFNMAVNKSIFSGSTGPQANLFKPASVVPPPPVDLPPPPQPKKLEFPSTSSETKERTPTKRPLENDDASTTEKKPHTDKHELLRRQLEAELRLKAERERLELLEMISAKSRQELQLLEDEVLEEMCSSVVQAELDRIELIDSLSERAFEGMLGELCAGILDDQLFVQDMLIEVERRLRDRLLLKYCRAWKQWAAKRRAQRREALDNTPVWLQPESVEECARKLYNPQQKIAIRHARESRKRRSLEQAANKVEEQQRVKHAPIALIVNVGLKENAKSFDVETSQRNFWKMVVSWPLLENRLTAWRHKRTINKYLSPTDFTQEPIFIEHKPGPHERLDICIRYFEGLICENCLTGMDALLFIIFGDEDERSVEQRLTKTILGRGKLPPIPLVIVVFGDDEVDPTRIQISALLETVLESGHVSEYTILHERSVDENVVLRVFQSATLWLAINRSSAVPLEMDYLKRVFDDCLTEELWLRIQGHLSHDRRYSAPLNDPNFIINLHNEAVNYLTDIIMDNESMSYTEFAPELKIFLDNKRPYPCTYEHFDTVWKHPEYRAELVHIMSSFVFPPWTDEWPIRDMMQLHDAIVDYCRRLFSREDSLAITSNVMGDLFLIAGFGEDSRPPSFADILLHIMGKKISDIPGNTRVVYNKNHVKHFQTLPWWFKSNALVEYMANFETDMMDDSENPIVQEITASTSQIDLDFECDIDELNETCKQVDEQIPVSELCEETQNQLSEVQSVAELLDKQLEEQKLKNDDFEARLKAALGSDFPSDSS